MRRPLKGTRKSASKCSNRSAKLSMSPKCEKRQMPLEKESRTMVAEAACLIINRKCLAGKQVVLLSVAEQLQLHHQLRKTPTKFPSGSFNPCNSDKLSALSSLRVAVVEQPTLIRRLRRVSQLTTVFFASSVDASSRRKLLKDTFPTAKPSIRPNS